MANASIFQSLIRPVRSVAEYDADYDMAEGNKLKLAAARMGMERQSRADADAQAVRGLAAQYGGDENALIKALRSGGYVEQAAGIEKGIFERRKGQSDLDTADVARRKSEVEIIDKALSVAKTFVNPIQTPQQAAAYLQGLYNDPILGKVAERLMPFEQAVQQIPQDPAQLARWKAGHMAITGDKLIDLLRPKTDITPMGGTNSFGATDQFTGQRTETGSQAITQSADNAATQETARLKREQDAKESAAGRAVQYAGQRLQRDRFEWEKNKPPAAPGGGKPMTELQTIKRRDQIANDHKAAATTLANMDELLTSANEVITAPGLKGATGLQSYLPSWPDGGAARAEVKLKNLEGKVTQLGKAAAAMAGAIGPMAVQEWKIVRDMIAAIEPQKGEEALKEQIRLIESTAQGAAQRIREAYEKQYGPDFERFPEFQELPAPKAKPAVPPKPSPGIPDMSAIDAEIARRKARK